MAGGTVKARHCRPRAAISAICAAAFTYAAACAFVENLSPVTMAGMLAVLAAWIFLAAASRGVQVTDRAYRIVTPAVLAAIGMVQIRTVSVLRFAPVADLESIYNGAVQWLETGSFEDHHWYFYMYPNNFGGLVVIRMLLQIGSLFTDDYFYAAAAGNTVMILAAFLFTSLSARELYGNKAGILVLVFFAAMPAWLFMPSVCYTDSLSAPFPVLAFYLYLKARKARGAKFAVLCAASGCAVAVGAMVKATVGIAGIAIAIAFLLDRSWRRAAVYACCAGALCLLASYSMGQYFYSRHMDRETADRLNMPVVQWIMIGSGYAGRYIDAYPDFENLYGDPDERADAIVEEIRKHVGMKGLRGMLELYSYKFAVLLGDGTLQLSDFLDDRPAAVSGMHDWLLRDGLNYKFYKILCNVLWYSLLILAVTGACFEAWYAAVKGPGTGGMLVPMLSVAGMLLFFMFWEVSERYITNYAPMVLLLSAGGIRHITDRLNAGRCV